MVSDLRDRDNDNNDDGTENYDVVHWSIQKKKMTWGRSPLEIGDECGIILPGRIPPVT